MNVFEYFKKKGIDTLNSSFYMNISVWDSWYKSNVRKFHQYRIYGGQGAYTRRRRHSLGMAKKVCEDMANLLLNERVKITVSDQTSDAFVKKVLSDNNFFVLGNEYQERKAATGTVAYIPYLKDAEINELGEVQGGTVGINYVEARNIFPVSWENGTIKECVFLFSKTCNRKKYAQFQFHRIEAGRYVIENMVVECTSGAGRELKPEEWDTIPAFKDLAPKIETGSDKRQFVIDRLNLVNNADEDDTNPMGVPIFVNSIDILRKIDLTYDSYANEFDLGRKRIFVAPEMLDNKDGSPTFDTDDTVFYRLPEDYMEKSKEPIKEINMALRIAEHSQAINDDLNYLSMKCGFGTERYRFDTGGIKTATEVISENSDMYRTLQKHELILDSVIRELIHIIISLGITLRNKGLNEDTEITIDFDDSIIEDKQTERSEDRKDVAMGVMGLPEYRAKWYAETEAVAARKIPEQTGVMP
ncbi:MAG: phage portal protein [Hungatella sp.]